MAKKYPKSILILFVVCLIGAGVFYFSNSQKGNEIQLQTTPGLKLLNSHSYPEAGEEWVVSFETRGVADLNIIPRDLDTIGDLDFITLTCEGKEKAEDGSPQILEEDAIFYPNWQCDGVGELTHLVNIARKHTLKFTFGNLVAFAYNNPDSVTDSFTDESKVSATSSVVITGGQAQLCKVNGTACSVAGECCSDNCVDNYCCDTVCEGECDRCNVGGSLGTCTDVDSDCAGTGASCYCSGGSCQTCPQCQGCYSYSCAATTTDWGSGDLGCGSEGDDKRCYSGTCYDCSDTGGYLYDDGCSGCAGQGGDACWRKGVLGDSCDTVCSSYGECIAAQWNDDTNCTVGSHFYPGYDCLGTDHSYNPGYYSGQPTYTRYRNAGNNTSCTAGYGLYERFCVCDY